ncbi:MAG: hypothetical protein JXR96_12920 [Deltaproteobacteria bacterium]|nr:hypothetical protein [Deltaproteobacteria bacterium]
MERQEQQRQLVTAGVVRARCTCCSPPRELVSMPALDSCRLACPSSGQTYLDRGDGWYEPDGGCLEYDASSGEPNRAEPDVVSDRPVRSGPKTRIELERATFASGSEN